MNNLTNLKEWDDSKTIEQFIRRIKIFLVQKQIDEIEKEAARYKVDASEYLNRLNESICGQIDQIRSLSFPIITDIILSAETDALVNMPNGGSFNSDSLIWDNLFRQPIQVVTNREMSKSHKTSGHESAPCIIDDRLFISVDVNTNRERLLSEFSKLINKDFIPYNAANKSQVTATPKIVRENAFIQILDYRITKKNSLKNAHKQLPKPAEDEMSFVREQVRVRLSGSDPNSSTLSRSAQNALKNLDKWLAEPAYITKLINY